jgi:CheY-like chemotaxis protein
MDQDLERSKDAGFRAHLTKPVTAQALDEAIATVFEN